ncbi:MAG: M20 metallopeptidase family protein, partial [bacterium]
HVYSWPSSHVYFRPEVQMPGNDFFTITIKGQSAHGSAPHLGIDPIAIAAHLIVNVQMLHARMIDAKERFVVTFGQMTAGSAPNIIPDEAVLKGTIRTYDSEIREKIISHFQTIVRETAAMFQGEAELTFDMSVPVLYNDPAITSLLGEAFSRILPEDHVHPEIPPLSISDDFSHFGLRIPSVYVLLGAGMADYPAYSLHDARIVFDEEAMVTGCMLYVQAALTILDAYKK